MEDLLISLPILILSIVVHEYAHGWVAQRQGDNTAAMLGRLTLNPLPHIDPVGSVLVPGLLALLPGGLILGWAKPVPVNPRNFRNYKRGDILVSLAGVVSNLLLAILFAIILAVWVRVSGGVVGPGSIAAILVAMLKFGIIINIVLMLFNLIPIPPLDGSHLFYHLLPPELGARYRELGRYGFFILLALLYLGGLNFLGTWVYAIASTMLGVAGVGL